jgi:ribosome-associated protein
MALLYANICSFVKRLSQGFPSQFPYRAGYPNPRSLTLHATIEVPGVCRSASQYTNRRQALDPSELAHVIIGQLEERQAAEIVMLDLTEITPIADYFIICTAESDRQARTLQEILAEELKKQYAIRPLSTEGEPSSGWLLLDYNAVIVHIFSRDARTFYRLEELWKAAPVVLKIQ